MNTRTRLTLDNTPDALMAKLEYELGSGESIVMQIKLPKTDTGSPSRTLQQIEEACLDRTQVLCQHMLDTLRKGP